MHALIAAGALTLAACGSHGDPAITSVTIEPTTVAPGGTVTMTVVTENFELDEPSHSHLASKQQALRTQHGDEEHRGHLHIYLNTTEENPLVQSVMTRFPVVIPAETATGAHQLIVRLHGGDHRIIQPETKTTVDLTVAR